MFRITEDPSSGSLVQCLAENYKNDLSCLLTWTCSVLWQHIVTVVCVCVCGCVCVCVCVCVCSSLYFIYSELHTGTTVTICCHNTDLVHVNGHDRIILVIFSQALYKAP